MNYNLNQAIYLQIADNICENIIQGKWKAGDRIPSARELAIQMEVNPNTMMRTFSYLQDKGIIFNKRGIGYFIQEDGYEKSIHFKKQEFLEQELPAFVRKMKMLDIDMKVIEEMYLKLNTPEKNENV